MNSRNCTFGSVEGYEWNPTAQWIFQNVITLPKAVDAICSIRHQPLDQNDIPDYLARRVQMKPRVNCTIHGDICGFVVTTAKSRAFPAAVINGYIALNNAAHTVAVRHCETDHFLAGYRFFSFSNTHEQDYFVQYLDTILDSHVSMFKRNSALYYDYPMRGGMGEGVKPFGAYGQMQYMASPVSTRMHRGQLRKKTRKSSQRPEIEDRYAIDRLRRMAHIRNLQTDGYM
ncbi:hypothetical protein EGR_00041 [Echinococcus granulosus]|uniref:Uncharacterized protein n=1 Tax=Echinococcus granulosus TaxID=6210 RepID=W6V1G1_ECHGR|nr:hypothetical protein EGR_00041 [Echinococcus granulosus]EUB64772.1 hypothetical protein EGR_00041 [Echinococcus granulosus]